MTWIYQSVNTILSAPQWKIPPLFHAFVVLHFLQQFAEAMHFSEETVCHSNLSEATKPTTIRFCCVKYPNCSISKCFDGLIDIGYIQCISHFTMPMLSARENENYIILTCMWMGYPLQGSPRFLIHLGGYISVKVTNIVVFAHVDHGQWRYVQLKKSLKNQWELLGEIGLERRPLEARHGPTFS